jgi:hypothetical protein
MRYLRKYNENFTDMTDPNLMKLQNDFRDFANDCLAYLVDEGFIISVAVRNTYDGCLLEFTLVKNQDDINFGSERINFTWNSIKDDFIPFLELVKEKFIVDHIVKFTTNKITTLNIDVVINDDTNISGGILRNDYIRNISFFIKDYK